MSNENFLEGGWRFCRELQHKLKEQFSDINIRVVPKHDGLGISMESHMPQRFTIEITADGAIEPKKHYRKWCIDIDAGDYLRWCDEEHKQPTTLMKQVEKTRAIMAWDLER